MPLYQEDPLKRMRRALIYNEIVKRIIFCYAMDPNKFYDTKTNTFSHFYV